MRGIYKWHSRQTVTVVSWAWPRAISICLIWLPALSAFSTRLKQSSGLDDLSAPGVWMTCGLTILNVARWKVYLVKNIWRGIVQNNLGKKFYSNFYQNIALLLRYWLKTKFRSWWPIFNWCLCNSDNSWSDNSECSSMNDVLFQKCSEKDCSAQPG